MLFRSWVTIRPGVASRISPGRVTGLAFNSSPVAWVWLAVCTSLLGPEPMFGAPEGLTTGVTGRLIAAWTGGLRLGGCRDCDLGADTLTAGKVCGAAGATVVWLDAGTVLGGA